MTFLDVWVGYAIFGVTLFSLVFTWAVRARQFSNLDRGRFIPLEGEESVAVDEGRCASRADRLGLAVVIGIVAVLLLAALVIGVWCAGHGTSR